jgi:hypothetical protein
MLHSNSKTLKAKIFSIYLFWSFAWVSWMMRGTRGKTLYVQSSYQSINQSKRKTSNVQNLTHLGHEHQAPDHEATQPMMGY